MKTKSTFKLNSWHYLAGTLGLSAIALVTLWFQVEKPRFAERGQKIAAAERRLADLKLLSEGDIVALDKKSRECAEKTAAITNELKAAGIDDLPVGQPSVMGVQQAVLEALVVRKLKVVETSASARAETKPVAVAEPKKVAKPVREMTAAEYEAESMKAAASLDAKMKKDYLKRVKAQVAKMKAAEARQATAARQAAQTKPAAVKQTVTSSGASVAPYKTENLFCKAQGRFRDIFLFFVGESFKKPSYNFSEITVRPSLENEDVMDLSFTLQANYK